MRKRIFATLAMIAFALPASAQPVPLVEDAPAQVQPVKPPEPVPYDAAHAKANLLGKPFVVFVGIAPRDVKGCVTIGVASFNGSAKQRIVVCPNVNEPDANYYAVNDDAAIRQRAGLAVQPMASPFSLPRPESFKAEQAEVADDRFYAGGRWQVGLAFLNDLEPYTTAKRVQLTTRRWSGGLGSVDRLQAKPEWRIAGGLVGVSGWSNQLFRTPNLKQKTFLVRQDENDSVSAVTWWRNYTTDATFADVLRNDDGRIFEARVAEKVNGKWTRYVAFKDASARPHGYQPLTRSQCVECHNKAGLSEYGGVANPGADTVISDPMENVENNRYVSGGFGTQL